jgi:hypothetical protein
VIWPDGERVNVNLPFFAQDVGELFFKVFLVILELITNYDGISTGSKTINTCEYEPFLRTARGSFAAGARLRGVNLGAIIGA